MNSEEYRQYLQGLNSEHDACGIGVVANIDGTPDRRVLDDALSIVEKLEHRAGKDASGKVGDGVGILVQVCTPFFAKAAEEAGIKVGNVEKGDLGIGMFFFPKENLKRTFAVRMFEVICEKNGVEVLGWRKVPVHPEILGDLARDTMPEIRQAILARPEGVAPGLDFDRLLYVVRREFEQSSDDTYICSLSSRTIVYKGMFLVRQLRAFYDDLRDPMYETAISIVHSRFSTNTTPSWDKAHPYRMIAHNGEINTIRGNIDRMLAREETMSSPFLEKTIDKIYPVIPRTASDSAMMDNTLEFLYMNGMPLPLAMMALIPEPWKHDKFMKQERKDFYHYYATMMEAWDGPAAILFSDGELVGATLDRNGLRPARYYVTDTGRLILSSEVGVLDIPDEHIIEKKRLSPGRILLVDTKQKRIISDDECKDRFAKSQPYGEWLDRNLKHLAELPIPNRRVPVYDQETRDRLYRVFGYTYEDVRGDILPMAENGVEQTASMGHDAPLAVLSEKPRPLSHYFRQLFAQVTNPPIDSLREKIVTDTAVYIGSDGNLLEEKSGNVRMLEVQDPILTEVDLMKIRELNEPGLKAETLSILFYKHTSLKKALDQLCVAVDRAYAKGSNIIILSDRGVDENHVPIPSLLAVACVEQHLVRTKKRTQVSLILESAEPRDVHQFAVILGFGARAVCPYLAHECIGELIRSGILNKDYHTAVDDYNIAILNGIVKIAAKMGISTLQSYQSAKIFEAVGLSQPLIDEYFTGTVSRVGGIGLKEIEESIAERHDRAFDPLGLTTDTTLDSLGLHGMRNNPEAEDHLYNPTTIVLLQQSVREGNYDLFKQYTARVDDVAHPHTLRSGLKFVPAGDPVPLEEVEPASEIVKRFKTGAMSYGSISQEAHEAIAIAMNRLGGKSNTGEGGEDPARFDTEKCSAIKQVASARFGVTEAYLNSAKEIQIKMAQGAKPGEGGHLPGRKVYPWVAKTRHSTPGVTLISPPPHHDIYSIEDLSQLIYDLKNANKDARISVKLVSEAGVGTIASGVAKAGAQVILISGHDGGSGAAPKSSIHHAGLPWELGLSEAHRTLIENGLRERVILETDGKLMSGRDVAIAALLGAEEFGFATTALVCLGCMMMRVCNKDTCPFGIATQNAELRKRFKGKPEYVMNFMTFIAEELREIMAELGFRSVNEMVGRTDCLQQKVAVTKKARTVDLSVLLEDLDPDTFMEGPVPDQAEHLHFMPEKVYDFRLGETLDEKVLLPAFEKNLGTGEPGEVSVKVSSTNRTFGTLLGSQIQRRLGNDLPDDTFTVHAEGGGGQSFGAFIPKGLTIRLSGDANDGFGKGLSGGKLVLTPPAGTAHGAFAPEENIIVGNVALYGATSGKVYIDGIAGERFCIRNSGAVAVAWGCGDHGLEYMTGGRAVILGNTGKNFAAGMSGGIAYVLDRNHDLYLKLNKDMVELEEVTEKYDIQELTDILSDFAAETGSAGAKRILDHLEEELPYFKKIIPHDYKRMLAAVSHFEETGIPHEAAELEAFRSVYDTEEK
ncbi:MAG: glutamate synthase large subunit [Lachnospiraceae bacterium]|nr:glutamate synthase large subunit [Lachnospiraceae bacterium]